MKSALALDLNDTQRRQIKRALGFRGGRATRKEIKAWAGRALAEAINRLPEPPPVRRKLTGPSALTVPAKLKETRTAVAYKDVADQVPCGGCTVSRAAHNCTGYCPGTAKSREGNTLATAPRFQHPDKNIVVRFAPKPPRAPQESAAA